MLFAKQLPDIEYDRDDEIPVLLPINHDFIEILMVITNNMDTRLLIMVLPFLEFLHVVVNRT